MLRPVSARWFEALVPRESVARALEALAATGFVQLEPDPYDDEAGAELVELPPLDNTLARLSALQRRYHDYWPAPEPIEARRDRRLERELGAAMRALGHLRRVAWLAEHLEGITTSEYMARLRGWTCEDDPGAIEHALERAGIPAAVSMPLAPRGRQAPSLCVNPPWARPFELFAGLVGTPGRDEADPSLLVAMIAPLLFGYMFGDVGHGAVLIALGLGFKKRFPGTALMIWGGAWAVLFGLLFGSLFGREDVVPALWLHPVSEPLPVLFVPLLFGAFLIFLSFLLNGLEHAWSGRFGEWLLTEAGLPLALILFGAALIHPELFWAVALMLLAQYAGLVAAARHKGAVALVGALGELLEALMQLVVNTLSFIRVGAFALAHAGLSLAVISLADSTSSVLTWLLVMAVGNALIIAIEGLVASIQTTRLVLFEFFNRFLSAGGRAFEPLAPPSASLLPTFKELVP